MEIIGSLILSLTQSILFYGKQIGISMLIFEVVCNGIILFVLNQSLPGWFGKTDECTLFSKKLHDVYSLVLKENFVLYLY